MFQKLAIFRFAANKNAFEIYYQVSGRNGDISGKKVLHAAVFFIQGVPI